MNQKGIGPWHARPQASYRRIAAETEPGVKSSIRVAVKPPLVEIPDFV